MNFLKRNKIVVSALIALLFVVLAIFKFVSYSERQNNGDFILGTVWSIMALFYGIDSLYELRKKKLQKLQ